MADEQTATDYPTICPRERTVSELAATVEPQGVANHVSLVFWPISIETEERKYFISEGGRISTSVTLGGESF